MIFQNKPINTMDRVINVHGRVFYNDRRRRIDLKRPICDLFDQEEPAAVFYNMELCLSSDKAVERVNELSEQNVIPVLLYFVEGEK